MLATLCVVIGTLVVVVTLVDAVGALVLPRGLTSSWRLSRIFYHSTWKAWRAVARRLTPGSEARELLLAIFAPIAILSLLVVWLVALVVGWALIYWPFTSSLTGEADSFLSVVYYSGAALLTVGFGDITATSTPLRLLSLVESAMGLGLVALVISYLPTLYAAYSRREVRLVRLDSTDGSEVDPLSIVAFHATDGDLADLYRFFDAWEEWAAEVLETHVAYPMLALFRSQQRGQSWVTALAVVLDAATLTCACVPGAEHRQPFLMHQRGRRALDEISVRLGLDLQVGSQIERPWFDHAYGELRAYGLELRPCDEAWGRFEELRSRYGATLQALGAFLLTPSGFWGHTAFDEDQDNQPTTEELDIR